MLLLLWLGKPVILFYLMVGENEYQDKEYNT